MITAANLKSRTVKDLAQLAREYGVPGWHSMRKDQLVSALVRVAKTQKASKPRRSSASGPSIASQKHKPARRGVSKKSPSGTRRNAVAKSKGRVSAQRAKPAKRKSPRASRRIQEINAQRQRQKDLTTISIPHYGANGATNGHPHRNGVEKDRIVLLVRDPFWLQACWELSRQSVERAQAAMAEQWHTARPILRVLEVDSGATTSTAERIARDIDIHGGVSNWYVDVHDPPKSYRVEIGYLSAQGRFFSLARSNTVTTPSPGSCDAIDENWTDIAENYEKIFALSGGYDEDNADGELRELFEERLRRPMGSPVVARYGVGAERMLNRHRDFNFEVDAEIIIYGTTKSDAHVTLAGEPVRLRPDGTFTVRLSMPDRRQVIPVVASSSDGIEQRTIVLAIERNTKVMEPVIHESNE